MGVVACSERNTPLVSLIAVLSSLESDVDCSPPFLPMPGFGLSNPLTMSVALAFLVLRGSPALVPCYGLNPSHRIAEVKSEEWTLKRRPFKTELLRDGGEMRGSRSKGSRALSCHTETFLELFILLQFFQFSSSRNFQQKLPNRAKPGCQRLLNSCSRAKTGLALLLGPRGSLPLKKANASPDPPPSALKRRERGERPPPRALEADPQARRPGGRGRASTRTHSPRARARPLSCRGRGVLEPRPYATSRYCCSVGGLPLPVHAEGSFDDRPRWDAVTVGLDVDHER